MYQYVPPVRLPTGIFNAQIVRTVGTGSGSTGYLDRMTWEEPRDVGTSPIIRYEYRITIDGVQFNQQFTTDRALSYFCARDSVVSVIVWAVNSEGRGSGSVTTAVEKRFLGAVLRFNVTFNGRSVIGTWNHPTGTAPERYQIQSLRTDGGISSFTRAYPAVSATIFNAAPPAGIRFRIRALGSSSSRITGPWSEYVDVIRV